MPLPCLRPALNLPMYWMLSCPGQYSVPCPWYRSFLKLPRYSCFSTVSYPSGLKYSTPWLLRFPVVRHIIAINFKNHAFLLHIALPARSVFPTYRSVASYFKPCSSKKACLAAPVHFSSGTNPLWWQRNVNVSGHEYGGNQATNDAHL